MLSGIGANAGARADVLYAPGDVITVGETFKIKVLATPGHTAGCLCYYTASGGVGRVFTGDALLIRGCGRTDFQGGALVFFYVLDPELRAAHPSCGRPDIQGGAPLLHARHVTKRNDTRARCLSSYAGCSIAAAVVHSQISTLPVANLRGACMCTGSSDTLYDSVHSQIFTLPDETAVYPAHDYKGATSSSVKEEKACNPRLTKTKEEFSGIMKNLNLPYPKKIDLALPANIICGSSE